MGGTGSATRKAIDMGDPHPSPRPDLKAVLFLVITLGLAALELWGLIRLF